MRDPVIESKVSDLKELVDKVNLIMSDLQDMNVEVKIAYISKDEPGHSTEFGPGKQCIKLWRVEERNGYI